MKIFNFLLIGLLISFAANTWSQVRGLSGLEPERLSETELKFHRGHVANIDGSKTIEFKDGYTIDTSKVGAGGMAYTPFTSGVDYFAYVIINESSVPEEIGITLSDEISTSNVQVPNNWEVFRKIPWGFVAVNGAYIPGGVSGVPEIPTFHLSHWPKPFTLLTQMTTESNLNKVLVNGGSTNWKEFPVSKLIPDNARQGYFLFDVTGSGEVFIRTGGLQANGMKLKPGQHFLHHRITSGRTLFYKATGNAKLTVYILGYSQTEPS